MHIFEILPFPFGNIPLLMEASEIIMLVAGNRSAMAPGSVFPSARNCRRGYKGRTKGSREGLPGGLRGSCQTGQV